MRRSFRNRPTGRIRNEESSASSVYSSLDTTDRFSKLYADNYNRLCAYAYQFVRDHHHAEDIVQQSFLKLWEKQESLDYSSELTNLLYTIVRHTSLDFLKKRKADPMTEEGLEMLAKENIVNEMIYSETLVEIYRIAKHLPEKYRNIFDKLFIAGKDHAEAASELNITESNLRMQKSRALSFIRMRLKISSLLLFFL